jgi:hypothetical protein
MYRRQKGSRVIGIRLVIFFGIFLTLTCMSIGIFVVGGRMGSHLRVFLIALVFPWMIFTLLHFASIYPSFKFSEVGLHYRYLHFFGGLIKWEEISEVIEKRFLGDMIVYAIIIEREGYRLPFALKGLYFPTVHAMRMRISGPVILITPQSITEEEISKIKENTRRSNSFGEADFHQNKI